MGVAPDLTSGRLPTVDCDIAICARDRVVSTKSRDGIGLGRANIRITARDAEK